MTLAASMPWRLPRPLTAVFWVTVIAFGLLSLAIATRYPGTTYAGRSVEAAVAKLLAGSALIGAGLYLWFGWRRPASGALFGLAAFAWWLEEWNNPATGVGAVFTVGLVGYAIASAVVAHAVLAYPFGRLASPLERLICCSSTTARSSTPDCKVSAIGYWWDGRRHSSLSRSGGSCEPAARSGASRLRS